MKPTSLFAPVTFMISVIWLLLGCSESLQGFEVEPPVSTVIIATPSDGVTGSVAVKRLRIRIPARQADAPVRLVARNGEAETYIAADSISVSYQQGVLIATRGLGADLMAGDASTTLTALQMPGSGTYSRQMRYLTSTHQSTWIQAGCDMKAAGADIRGGRTLSRYEEKCVARSARFTNIYWLDSSAAILSSKQWVSATVGYLESDPADR